MSVAVSVSTSQQNYTEVLLEILLHKPSTYARVVGIDVRKATNHIKNQFQTIRTSSNDRMELWGKPSDTTYIIKQLPSNIFAGMLCMSIILLRISASTKLTLDYCLPLIYITYRLMYAMFLGTLTNTKRRCDDFPISR